MNCDQQWSSMVLFQSLQRVCQMVTSYVETSTFAKKNEEICRTQALKIEALLEYRRFYSCNQEKVSFNRTKKEIIRSFHVLFWVEKGRFSIHYFMNRLNIHRIFIQQIELSEVLAGITSSLNCIILLLNRFWRVLEKDEFAFVYHVFKQIQFLKCVELANQSLRFRII